MKLVRGAWKLLVGIKDGLVLIFMLAFFGLIFAALSSRPNAIVKDGALVIDMSGAIVEQPNESQGIAALSGGGPKQLRLRDLLRALDKAKDDRRVKAVVLDMDSFGGGYPASVTEVARAVAAVRKAGKPVLAYATGYMDAGYLIASAATEVWEHPMGGTLFTGPGGNTMYYKGLADKLGINVHVYRVGKFKSFVEPYTRTDQSPEAAEASRALYATLIQQWQQNIATFRPKARIQPMLTTPDQVIASAQGDMAQANLRDGIVDKLGDRVAFGKHVAEMVGAPSGKPAGTYNEIKYTNWLAANPLSTSGSAIGVVTVAGSIVDGKAPNGTAGGETIRANLLKGLAEKNLKALVVRVDSGGGSALASEEIRQAVLEVKRRGIPVVVSFGGVAASGGYWVATAGDTIFAEPTTITGSIGIFGILPTFENSLAKIGVTSDGVKTTPLSGQPDVTGGTTQQLDTVLQSGIEHGYRQFIARVSAARKMTPERVNEIGQGRVWDGGTAHQLGLIDRFGTLNDALAEAAKRANLTDGSWHALWLEKKPGWLAQLSESLNSSDDKDDAENARADVFSQIAFNRRNLAVQALGDLQQLVKGPAIQARCLECDGLVARPVAGSDAKLMDLILARLWP